MPKVFVVQEPLKRDPSTGQMVPMMDFTKALEYGELVFCLAPGPVAFASAPTINRLKEVFKDFSDDDYFVAAGDPSAIAIAAAVLGEVNNGYFKILKWDKMARSYIEVEVNIKRRVI